MSRRPLVVVAVILGSLLSAPPAHAIEPVVVVDGVSFPAGIAFDSGGTMFVTEREGRILAFRDRGAPRTIASIPTITQGETGLLGIAVSPDDRYVYAFATEHDQTNTVWRVSAEGGEPERVITGLPGSGYHNGGGVAFGPDGMLYVSNGERHDSSIAQDPDALGGKVYRYTPEGTVPADNPFGDSPAYAIGLRNPYGLAIDPVSGVPFVTENGPESHDEINRTDAGGNYGWPVISGRAGETDTSGLTGTYHEPIADYEDIIVPTGLAFADPATAREQVAGDLFFGTYGDQTIHRLVLTPDRTGVERDVTFYRSPEPVIALAWGPRGLYFSTPGAIKLFALARTAKATTPDSVATAPANDEDLTAPRNGDGQGPSVAIWLFSAAGLVLVGALWYAFGGKKRGRA